ncbi:MAG: putative sugar O-methyltransferase [Dehalococcoidia bacterium]|jgi:hypothetical protein
MRGFWKRRSPGLATRAYNIFKYKGFLTLMRTAIAFLRINIEQDWRLEHMLLHPSVRGYPPVVAALNGELKPTTADESIAARLIKAFKKAAEDECILNPASSIDVWGILQRGPHSAFLQLLRDENTTALAAYLCNMSRLGISEGLVQGEDEYRKIISSRKFRKWLAVYNADKLVALGEAMGVLPCKNPEQGKFVFNNIYSNLDEVVEKIEKYLQISIIPPNIEGCLFKLRTKKGTISYRDIFAVYTAWRIRELLKGPSSAKVCEIGGGIGKLAYYAHSFGIRNYTIVDLPYVNVLQGYYLIKCLPQANIILYGESKANCEDIIEIMPYWSFEHKPEGSYDLTINSDSFPEIDKKTVLNYLKNIKRNTKNYFLSVNQEGRIFDLVYDFEQSVVSELVEETGGFRRLSRFPFWLRKGYVEEVFEIKR